MKTNTACLFPDVNQWDEKITRMACTIYAWFINAKYNGVIPSFTEADIKIVMDRQLKKWLWSETAGWKLVDWILAVKYYIENDLKLPCSYSTSAKDSDVMNWINAWFAVNTWIKVNKLFWQDKKDWHLDAINYIDYKWDTWHSTNIAKWNCRGGECADKGKEFFIDSYFIKDSTYTCNIKEVLEDIDLINKYILYP